MIKSRFLMTLFFLLTFAFFSSNLSAKNLSTELVFFNDFPLTLNHNPILIDNRIYVQLRDIAEVLNLTVSYNEKTQEARVKNPSHTFSYNLLTQNASLDTVPVLEDSPPLLMNNFTWVPIVSFAKLFGFDAEHNESLVITEYLGEEELQLDFLPYPISMPLYEYIPVSSAFINTALPSESYINGTYSVYIESASLEHMKPLITLLPFTEINYPKEYTLISDSKLFNFSDTSLNLPVSTPLYYTYLTYDPDTFSTATTTNPYILYEDIKEKRLLIADVTIKDGVITHIHQIYVP